MLASPERDRLRRDRYRAQARPADLLDAPRRDFLGDARGHRRLPRRVLALAGGQHLAEDHFADLAGFDSGIAERGEDRHPAKLMRGGVGEGAEEAADGRAASGGDDDVGHG